MGKRNKPGYYHNDYWTVLYDNQKKFAALKENDWVVVLAKCKKHIRLKLKQKTLSGAHAASNVGADPVDHYLSMAYTKLLEGEWE